MTDEQVQAVLKLVREYGDRTFRAGALSAFASRVEAQERTAEADQLLSQIEKLLREATK